MPWSAPSRRAYIIGIEVGQTNVFFFDAEGRQMAGFDIAVTRDLNGIRAAISQVLPDADIRVEGIGEGVVLSGTASSQAEAQQAYDIAVRLLGAGSADTVAMGNKVVNAIVVRGRDQIMLKVTVAEVERDVIKQLGINLSGSTRLRHGRGQFQQHQSVLGATASRSATRTSPADGKSITATLAGHGAGRRHSHARRAEPHGHFRRNRDLRRRRRISRPQRLLLLGRQHGTRSERSSICQPSIEFKKFGVSLNFTPVVLSEGRISLKVMTEVSDLSSREFADDRRPGHDPER